MFDDIPTDSSQLASKLGLSFFLLLELLIFKFVLSPWTGAAHIKISPLFKIGNRIDHAWFITRGLPQYL